MSAAHHPDDVLVVLTTVPDAEVGRRIARELVERRLAACVQILPGIQSTYRWQGAIEESSEVLVLAKSTRGRLLELQAALHELHPYAVPECVALEAAHVAEPYRAWLCTEVA